MRPSGHSLYTISLAAIDIGLGSVLHHHLTAPVGALLIAVGLLVLVGAMVNIVTEIRTSMPGNIDRQTPDSR